MPLTVGARKEGDKVLKRTAQEQVDSDRLLEGEDPQTRYVEDAAHWVTVYSELLLFKERLVDSAQGGLLDITDAVARQEATSTDLQVLLAERARLRGRLEFWKGRQRELGHR
jgi:hypothetical protein